MVGEKTRRLLAQLAHLRDLFQPHNFISTELKKWKNKKIPHSNTEVGVGLTSCSAIALWPVTRRHMMMCSSRMTWNDERMGLQSNTEIKSQDTANLRR